MQATLNYIVVAQISATNQRQTLLRNRDLPVLRVTKNRGDAPMNKYEITYNAPGVVNAKSTIEAPDKKTALTLCYLSTPGALEVLEVLDVKKVSSSDE